jgi:hypothetical protein
MVSEGTKYTDALMEIRSPNGIKRITLERLSEITMESFILGKLGRDGTNKERSRNIFDRLLEEELARA